jgi:predicted ATPase
MRVNLDRHNQIIDLAIKDNCGNLFKRIGDATCSTFDSPNEAVAAAIAGQLSISIEDWGIEAPIRVRWAIHEGLCLPEGSDFLGTSVNYVARILSLAHADQILVSAETAKSISTLETMWLGLRNLKGIKTPAGICQVLHPNIPINFPPLPGQTLGESNLPISFNQFIGRRQAIENLRTLLQTKRLVTIIGPGGAGKTRSALEVASKIKGNFGHGVWVANFAHLSRGDMVIEEIATAVNHPKAGEATESSLVDLLNEQHLLLILDNCEHVLAEAARIGTLILSHCPQVVILATSRSPLQIAGEARFPLESLSLPNDPSIESLQSSEAVLLFEDRARDVDPIFQLSKQNSNPIFSLVRRLDGIPLALELAAAQLASYTVDDIDRLLTERVMKLRSEDPSALPHRRTTDTTIDWSYQLLSQDERWLCRRIAVFSGGADREAIEFIAGTNTALSLQKIVNSSLVKFDPTIKRYGMLELVKEFMTDRLIESEEINEVRDRHLDWVVNLAQEARPNLDGREQAKWLDRLEIEHANVRVAMTWSISREQRLRAAIALHWFWVLRGHVREGQAWLEGSLSGYTPNDQSLHAQAESALGVLYWVQGQYERAKTHLEHAHFLAEQSDDLPTSVKVLANLGMVRAQGGDLDSAEQTFLSALEGFKTLGDQSKQAHVLNNIGVVHTMRGNPEGAIAKVSESIDLYREMGDLVNVGLGLTNVASSLRKIGKFKEATQSTIEAAHILLDLKDYGAVGYCLVQLAFIAFEKRDFNLAAQIQGKVTSLLNSAGYHLSPDSEQYWKSSCLETKDQLGENAYEVSFQMGVQQPIEVYIDENSHGSS